MSEVYWIISETDFPETSFALSGYDVHSLEKLVIVKVEAGKKLAKKTVKETDKEESNETATQIYTK